MLYLKEKNETIYFSIFISTDGSTIVTQEDIILPTWRNRSSLLGLLLFPESFLLIKTTSKVSNCKYMCKAMPSKKIEFGILISPNFVRAQVLANRMAWTCFVSDHTTKNFFSKLFNSMNYLLNVSLWLLLCMVQCARLRRIWNNPQFIDLYFLEDDCHFHNVAYNVAHLCQTYL